MPLLDCHSILYLIFMSSSSWLQLPVFLSVPSFQTVSSMRTKTSSHLYSALIQSSQKDLVSRCRKISPMSISQANSFFSFSSAKTFTFIFNTTLQRELSWSFPGGNLQLWPRILSPFPGIIYFIQSSFQFIGKVKLLLIASKGLNCLQLDIFGTLIWFTTYHCGKAT